MLKFDQLKTLILITSIFDTYKNVTLNFKLYTIKLRNEIYVYINNLLMIEKCLLIHNLWFEFRTRVSNLFYINLKNNNFI